MIVIYKSNTGYTRQYAKLLAKALDIPAYSADSIPEVHKGGDAIFLGWLMAGSIVGYKKVAKYCNVKAAIGVGMSPPAEELVPGFRAKMHIPESVAVFYLQGGFDISKLKGPFKLIMKIKVKDIAARLTSKPSLTPQEQATLDMTAVGASCVCEENLAEILAWAK
ncbi:MAG: hypothetical protein RR314_01680 [Oscillospiraceae bacterium]